MEGMVFEARNKFFDHQVDLHVVFLHKILLTRPTAAFRHA